MTLNPLPPRKGTCQHCGREMIVKRKDKRYCSDACRNRAYKDAMKC